MNLICVTYFNIPLHAYGKYYNFTKTLENSAIRRKLSKIILFKMYELFSQSFTFLLHQKCHNKLIINK